jgi:hypothetical protein
VGYWLSFQKFENHRFGASNYAIFELEKYP